MSTSGESKSKSAKAEGGSLPDSEGPKPVPVNQTEEPEKAGKSQTEDPSPLHHVKSEFQVTNSSVCYGNRERGTLKGFDFCLEPKHKYANSPG